MIVVMCFILSVNVEMFFKGAKKTITNLKINRSTFTDTGLCKAKPNVKASFYKFLPIKNRLIVQADFKKDYPFN